MHGSTANRPVCRCGCGCSTVAAAPSVAAADRLRRDLVGDTVTWVANRNINYTNVCTFKCKFCGFAKGKISLNLHYRYEDVDEARFDDRGRASTLLDRGLQLLLHGLDAGDQRVETRGRELRVDRLHQVDFHPERAAAQSRDIFIDVFRFAAELPLDFQAQVYADALAACADAAGCDTFVTWGITDRFSPIPAETGGAFGGALVFDADDAAKPAFEAMAGVLRPLAIPSTTTAPVASGSSQTESRVSGVPPPFQDTRSGVYCSRPS